MTAHDVVEVKEIIDNIRERVGRVLSRAGPISCPGDMSEDDFVVLAKEVEEVGELIHQLEHLNPHIVPALFEVPHGGWSGWSGLENFRNVVTHDFRRLTREELFLRVKERLALRDVAHLLGNVKAVRFREGSFDVGSRWEVLARPRTRNSAELRPGSSAIELCFGEEGNVIASRTWRDDDDNWRCSIRWVHTRASNDESVTIGFRDADFLLVPRVMGSDNDGGDGAYNLVSVPPQNYFWRPEMIGCTDSVLERKRK